MLAGEYGSFVRGLTADSFPAFHALMRAAVIWASGVSAHSAVLS